MSAPTGEIVHLGEMDTLRRVLTHLNILPSDSAWLHSFGKKFPPEARSWYVTGPELDVYREHFMPLWLRWTDSGTRNQQQLLEQFSSNEDKSMGIGVMPKILQYGTMESEHYVGCVGQEGE
jgi:hypothetical protein